MANFNYNREPEVLGARKWGVPKRKVTYKGPAAKLWSHPTYTRNMYAKSGSKLPYMSWVTEQKRQKNILVQKKIAYQKWLERERKRRSVTASIVEAAKRKELAERIALAKARAVGIAAAKKSREDLAKARAIGVAAAQQRNRDIAAAKAAADTGDVDVEKKGMGTAAIIGLIGAATAGYMIFAAG